MKKKNKFYFKICFIFDSFYRYWPTQYHLLALLSTIYWLTQYHLLAYLVPLIGLLGTTIGLLYTIINIINLTKYKVFIG